MTNLEPEDGYPPDKDYDQDPTDVPGEHVPVPRGKQVRGVLQANKPRSKQRRRVVRGTSRIISQQKRRQALEFRKAGMTYAQIADQVGFSNAGAARKSVLKAFGEVIQEPVAELKTIQVERLNHMLLTLWGKVSQGDETAINTSLRIMDKIDSLMGTEAARQVEVRSDTAVLVIDGNKDDYITALKKMAGAGVGPDGTNIQAQQVMGPGTGPQALPAAPQRNYPPGMGPTGGLSEDIVDGEVVEDVPSGDTPTLSAEGPKTLSDCTSPLGTVCKDPACPLHFGPRKKFKFGVDPTVRRPT